MNKVVYELMIDWDGTTRSRMCSEGLFLTRELAECKLKEIIGTDVVCKYMSDNDCSGFWEIHKRVIHER